MSKDRGFSEREREREKEGSIRGIERVEFDVNVLRNRNVGRGCKMGPKWRPLGGNKASVLVEKAGRWIGTRCNVCERMAEKEVEKKAGLSEWNGAGRWTGGLRGAVKKMATKKVKLTRARPGKKTRYGRPFIYARLRM